ncbi:hypothetical protein GCK32_021164, partial [Trichostrongylus colubriformis]
VTGRYASHLHSKPEYSFTCMHSTRMITRRIFRISRIFQSSRKTSLMC